MQSLEQIDGVWSVPEFESGLVLRCHAARKKPIDQLSGLELATLLNQNIGVKHILPEAIRRLAKKQPDGPSILTDNLRKQLTEKPNKASGGNCAFTPPFQVGRYRRAVPDQRR